MDRNEKWTHDMILMYVEWNAKVGNIKKKCSLLYDLENGNKAGECLTNFS